MLRKTKNLRGRQVKDTWTAEYSIGRTSSRCEICLTKTNRNKHDDEELSISLHDHEPAPSNEDVDFHMGVKVEQDCLVSKLTINGPSSLLKLPNCKENNPEAQGGVIKSSSFLYGRDTDERKGLIVILRAKRSDDDGDWPYMIIDKQGTTI
ncbi:MAG: hypothetical protein Q8877_03135 [Sweet potato little leaf phytoplasma]|nr:hypothetical protein [Sweet potato little leaf phytoplasma]